MHFELQRTEGEHMTELLFVSLIHILQNPQQYAEQPVRVIGVANIGFEATGLFVSEEDMRNAVTKNGIWLVVPSSDENRKLHGKYVLVEGVFDPLRKGHLGMWSGTLKDVKRLELWSDPDKTRPPPAPK
jgi:hypothetical protein